jgi:hypothetical protein
LKESERNIIIKICTFYDKAFDYFSLYNFKAYAKILNFFGGVENGYPTFRDRYLVISNEFLFIFYPNEENTILEARANLSKKNMQAL